MLDSRAGVTPLDEELGVLLRNTGKPIIIAANKVESKTVENEAGEFYQFGYEMSPISSEHGTGIGDLLDMVFEHLAFDEEVEEEQTNEIKLAIIGRPNVGKSSLLNQYLARSASSSRRSPARRATRSIRI